MKENWFKVILAGSALLASYAFYFEKTHSGIQNLSVASLAPSVAQASDRPSDNVLDIAKETDSWTKLQCKPTSKQVCEGSTCSSSEPTVSVILDRLNRQYRRCDTKGCDTYTADFYSSGIFTNVQGSSPMGAMVKVLGKREYVEVVTLGLGVQISQGYCSEIP